MDRVTNKVFWDFQGNKSIIEKQPPEVFCEKISQNSLENTCARDFFKQSCRPDACNFIKKETLAQVFLSEFWEMSKNTFFIEHLRTTASDNSVFIVEEVYSNKTYFVTSLFDDVIKKFHQRYQKSTIVTTVSWKYKLMKKSAKYFYAK